MAESRSFEKISAQAPGMMRHGSFPEHRSLETFRPPELLENKIAVQAAEIERLAGDNHRLKTSHVALRQDLGVAQQEVQKLKAHVRSIHTENDIQLRVLQDKILRKEADIRAGENVRRDLQKAYEEGQGLVKARDEVAGQIEQASMEMQKALTGVSNLPILYGERMSTRDCVPHLSMKNVKTESKWGQMQTMQKNLIAMAKEKQRAEIAEKKIHVPNPQWWLQQKY